jgi:hypothetical protein
MSTTALSALMGTPTTSLTGSSYSLAPSRESAVTANNKPTGAPWDTTGTDVSKQVVTTSTSVAADNVDGGGESYPNVTVF